MWLHFKGLYLEKENKVLRATHLLINICGNTLLGVLLFPQNWSKRFNKDHGGNPEIIEKVCEIQASVQTHLVCSHSAREPDRILPFSTHIRSSVQEFALWWIYSTNFFSNHYHLFVSRQPMAALREDKPSELSQAARRLERGAGVALRHRWL